MMPPALRKYLISALTGAPDVVVRLLKDVHADDPRWDFRPDPSRFTLREVVAHDGYHTRQIAQWLTLAEGAPSGK